VLLFAINDKVRNLKDDLNLRSQLNLSNEVLDNITVVLDKQYNAFDVRYEECNGMHRMVVIAQKCYNISKGVIQGAMNNLGLWDVALDYHNFAPSDYQELLMTSNISFLGFEKSGCSFEKFKKTFPNSSYLRVLETLQKSSKSSNIAPYTLLNYPIESDKMKIISTLKYTDIKELISKNFPHRPVFVDLWATYCAPCKAEFSHARELHHFLDTKNIVMLYVSVDSKEFTQKWENDIYQFKLNGNHYFASNELLNSLQKLVNEKMVAIPRYLLFNAKGELILKNTKKPSEGQKLYDQILNALN
jgi:thiol-disulfide isomerase/thioredoxin